MKFRQANQICSPLKIGKSINVELLVVRCKVKRVDWIKKTQDDENLFFKPLANNFWLSLKSYSRFNKVVHGRRSIKCAS